MGDQGLSPHPEIERKEGATHYGIPTEAESE